MKEKMNKEVSDALYMLLHCSLKDTEYETQKEQFKIVYNYITNLQQELQNYKDLDNSNMETIDCQELEIVNKENIINDLVQENKQLKEDFAVLKKLQMISNDILNELEELWEEQQKRYRYIKDNRYRRFLSKNLDKIQELKEKYK